VGVGRQMARQHRNSKASKQSLLHNRLMMGGLCAALVMLLALVWSFGNSEDSDVPVSAL